MFNLIEYSDIYFGTTGSLWKFKMNESHISNGTNPESIDTGNLTSFKYISSILGKQTDGRVLKKVIFWRSLQMSLIDCKIHLELHWTKDFVMSGIAGSTIFEKKKHEIMGWDSYFMNWRQCKTNKAIKWRI